MKEAWTMNLCIHLDFTELHRAAQPGPAGYMVATTVCEVQYESSPDLKH